MSSQFYTSRAEVSEHYYKIRYIQHADEHADPALELSADERRDHGCGADHEAGRNIQQHALIFDGEGLALQKRAQRHDERKIHYICTDDIADRQRGLLFADRRDGRDKLGQRCADSDHRRGDHGVGNADHDSQRRAVIDKQLRAEDYGASAEDELADVYRNVLAVGARALVGRLASLFALCGKDALNHKADENEHDNNALGNRQRTVAREGKQQHDRRKQQTGLDAELLSRHIAAHAHKRQAHDKSRVRRDRADGVADGDIGVALECREHGNEHFGHGRCEAHHRCAYDELGYAGGLGDPRCRIDEKVAALDNAYKADGEQHDNKCERASRKVNSHFDNSLIIFLAHKKIRLFTRAHFCRAKSLIACKQVHDHRRAAGGMLAMLYNYSLLTRDYVSIN